MHPKRLRTPFKSGWHNSRFTWRLARNRIITFGKTGLDIARNTCCRGCTGEFPTRRTKKIFLVPRTQPKSCAPAVPIWLFPHSPYLANFVEHHV
jgi:hypothetical protein